MKTQFGEIGAKLDCCDASIKTANRFYRAYVFKMLSRSFNIFTCALFGMDSGIFLYLAYFLSVCVCVYVCVCGVGVGGLCLRRPNPLHV